MDLWKTITVTVVGFFLTGIVGTWISYFWQTRNWRHQQEYGRNRELLSRQIEIVENISNLVGYRRFRMFRAAAALRSLDNKRIEESWKNYDDAVVKWNDDVNGYITKLRQFFNKRMQYDLDIHITPEFQRIGFLLETAKRKFDAGLVDDDYFNRLKRVSVELENFAGYSNTFVGQLWRHIDGLKNQMDGQPSINYENLRKLSYLYLIKSMFVLREKA